MRSASRVTLACCLVVLSAACGAPDDAGPGSEATAAPAAAAPAMLMPAPDLAGVELRDAHGEPVAFASLRGKPALLTFIYTRCPMPEMCPATTLRFQEVQKALSPEERAALRLISISFDPEYDTPEVLAAYGRLWEVDDSFWSLLTGSPADIQRVAAAYGVWYEKSEDGNYQHAMVSLILLPDGALHRVLTGSAWDAGEVAGILRGLAGGPR